MAQPTAQTVALYDAALKREYQPLVREILNSEILGLTLLDDSSEEYEGKGVSFDVNTARNPASGARTDGGSLMSSGSQTHSEAQFVAKYCYTRGELTGPSMSVSKSSKGSVARALGSEMKFAIRDAKKRMNFYLNTDGTGVMCTCDASTTSTTVEVKWAGQSTPDVAAPGTRYLVKGQNILIGTASEIAAGTANAVNVTSITDGDTFEATSNAYVSGDLIVEGDASGNSYNNVPMGYLGMIDDDTGTYINISRTTVPEWKGSILGNSGTLRTVTEDLIQASIDKAHARAGGKTSYMICDTNMRRQIIAVGTGDKRYMTRKIELGWEVIDYAGGSGVVPIYVDVDACYNKLIGIDKETTYKAILEDFHFSDDSGHILRFVSGKDSYEWLLRWFGNFYCDNPAANWILEDLTITNVVGNFA